MSKKIDTHWYDYAEIHNSLLARSQNEAAYHVIESASQDDLHLSQKVNEACTKLNGNQGPASAVIPINLGRRGSSGAYEGSHWVGLVIRRDPEHGLEAYYNDSLGTSMDALLPNLKQILTNNGIQNITDLQIRQQNNGYDCGPWTVLNLDSLARSGQLQQFSGNDISNQRQELAQLNPVASVLFSSSSSMEDEAKTKERDIPSRISRPEKAIGSRNYVDSSDSEEENDVRTNYRKRGGYIKSLSQDLDLDAAKKDSNVLKTQLGLVLHNYADRVFNSEEFRGKYEAKKFELFNLGEEVYDKATKEISAFLEAHTKSEQNIFKNPEAITKLSDQHKIQLFNYIFNKDIELPHGVAVDEAKVSNADARDALLNSLQQQSSSNKFDGQFLRRISGITLTNEDIAKDGGASLLTFASLVQRADRNQAKNQMITERDQSATHAVSIPSELRTSQTTYRIRESGKTQGLIFHLDTYEKILNELGGQGAQKQIAGCIKTFIRTGETQNIPQNDRDAVLDMTNLLFGVEVGRNRATMFTSAMFLDKMRHTGNVTPDDFPMSMKGAVDAVRDISSKYKDKLPNARTPDYGNADKHLGNTLLNSEGKVFAEWLERNGKPELNNAIKLIDCEEKLDKFMSSKSPKNISDFVEVIQNVKDIGLSIKLEPPLDKVAERRGKMTPNEEGKLEPLKDLLPKLREEVEKRISEDSITQAINMLNEKIVHEYYGLNAQNILSMPQLAPKMKQLDRSVSSSSLASVQNDKLKPQLKRHFSEADLSQHTEADPEKVKKVKKEDQSQGLLSPRTQRVPSLDVDAMIRSSNIASHDSPHPSSPISSKSPKSRSSSMSLD